jgi:Tfp pilus assembly protein PilV
MLFRQKPAGPGGRPADAGMTVIETLVAIVILGLTTTAAVSLVAAGDRMAGRRSSLSYATIIGKNEAERLRMYETSPVVPGDTAYSAVVNGIEFDVSRTRVRVRSDSIQRAVSRDSAVTYGEYAVSVKRKSGLPLSVSFRLLQGFYNENAH